MAKPLRALGLMSGTSLDGIDVAMLTTDGTDSVERGPSATYPYPPEFRAQLIVALADAKAVAARHDRPGCLADVERELTELHADAVRKFLHINGIDPASIDVIGFHGQTVVHRPARMVQRTISPPRALLDVPRISAETVEFQLTVQLGDGPLLAMLTNIDVVYDLRAADAEAGGQGAPLVPVYHQALAARVPERPAAFLNLGGVGNVTWIGDGQALIAFDTGPGNALIDDWVHQHTGRSHDTDGVLALSGQVNEAALAELLRHNYFGELPPKSLDRNTFSLDPVSRLSLEDGAATLVAFTAATVSLAVPLFPQPPASWIVCGGGRRNTALMLALAGRLAAAVAPAEVLNLDGDSLEAEAWAFLAVRSLRHLPITFPMTTGVSAPMTGGVLAPAGR